MTYKELYFSTHPNCKVIGSEDDLYPATEDGKCLCLKDIGYINKCYAGEGFFDCRDCWNSMLEHTILKDREE